MTYLDGSPDRAGELRHDLDGEDCPAGPEHVGENDDGSAIVELATPQPPNDPR